MRLVIEGRLDGLNNYIAACRTNHYKGAQVKSDNEKIVIYAIKSQLRGRTVSGPVKMRYRWYEKNQRRDLDNISSFGRKVIQDALVKTGVLVNDGWKDILGFSDAFFVDKDRPRIEVDIMEVRDDSMQKDT